METQFLENVTTFNRTQIQNIVNNTLETNQECREIF